MHLKASMLPSLCMAAAVSLSMQERATLGETSELSWTKASMHFMFPIDCMARTAFRMERNLVTNRCRMYPGVSHAAFCMERLSAHGKGVEDLLRSTVNDAMCSHTSVGIPWYGTMMLIVVPEGNKCVELIVVVIK